jgi:hypothetical protein
MLLALDIETLTDEMEDGYLEEMGSESIFPEDKKSALDSVHQKGISWDMGSILRPVSGFFLAVVLCATLVSPAEATPPARSDFVLKWPTVRAAVRALGLSDAARFEARVERLLEPSRSVIQEYPEAYVRIAEGFFFEALADLLKQALARGEAEKVDAFMADFNRRRSAYLIESAPDFSGCVGLELALEVSGAAGGDAQYLVVVWFRSRPPPWCRIQNGYGRHGGGYRAFATGVPAKAGAAWKPKDDPRASRTWVADIQRALTRLQYRPGPADGVAGRKTRQAIRQFQNHQGLVPDGLPTVELLKRLKAAGAPTR